MAIRSLPILSTSLTAGSSIGSGGYGSVLGIVSSLVTLIRSNRDCRAQFARDVARDFEEVVFLLTQPWRAVLVCEREAVVRCAVRAAAVPEGA